MSSVIYFVFCLSFGMVKAFAEEYIDPSFRTRFICESDHGKEFCNRKCGGIGMCVDEKCVCTKNVSRSNSGPVLDLVSLEVVPIMRHHIAHFCPNLDEARKCIRTCMEVGKPAFCGKDHICYCGHRYTPNDQDPNVDVNATYAQFKDLYTKYFGPNTNYHGNSEDETHRKGSNGER